MINAEVPEMNEQDPITPPPHHVGPRFLPLLLVLFVGSGCAALIYEIVWFQLLELVIGSSAVSLGVLLGTYMGGLCLGSLLLARLVSARCHPLRVYALLELGIGMIGIAVLFMIPAIDRFYASHAGSGLSGILLRGAIGALCLLPPTTLMGATLPAIARWLETTPKGISRLGFLYGSNTAGAVFGCLLAGFYLLRVRDMAVATYVAASINGLIALTGFALSVFIKHRVRDSGPALKPSSALPGSWPISIVIALSGLSALGAEVIWTRLLSLLLGATVYTFSIILAVFLVGLAIGSGGGAFLARRTERPREALAACQVFLMAAIAWTAYAIAKFLPYWTVSTQIAANPWHRFQLDLFRCLFAVLPGALLWGASFPLALRAVSSPDQDPGRTVGRIYASNTIGAIIGSLGFSMLLIPWIGTRQSQRVLIGVSAAAAILAFASAEFSRKARPIDPEVVAGPRRRRARWIPITASLALAALLAWIVPQVPWELIAYGRYLPTKTGQANVLYVGEGMNASVAVTDLGGGIRNFHVSGRIEASSDPLDMRMERMLGHLPALFHPKPRSILVVGCGAGVSAGTFVLYPGVERIVLCEIEPLIPRVVARMFRPENYGVLDDPRVQVITDDARHFILTTKERFDVITSDPIHPWLKGSAPLYSQEYFELCRRHLNPGGIIAQWVPLYESTPETVKSELATFFSVFQGGTIWSNDNVGWGYDVVLIGTDAPQRIDVGELRKRLASDPYWPVFESLNEVGFYSIMEVLMTYAGRDSDLKSWLKDAELNRDVNLRLQYLAGMGWQTNAGSIILDNIIGFRKYPEDLFIVSDEDQRAFQKAFGPAK